jgi:hypothetical protein
MYKIKNGFTINSDGKSINDREEIARLICNTANNDCLHITELWCWEELADKWSFGENEFIDDTELNSDAYFNGGYNWKYVSIN